MYNLDGLLIAKFKSGLAIKNILNIPLDELTACCRGERPDINGYTFKYTDDEKNSFDEDGRLSLEEGVDKATSDNASIRDPEILERVKGELVIAKKKSNCKVVEMFDRGIHTLSIISRPT